MKKMALSVSALALLAACGAEPVTELGSPVVADPGFGSAYINNVLVTNGTISATEQLGLRFAAEVDTTINFAFNSAALDAEARQTLAQQAMWIRQFPEVRFRVYGHTDLVGSAAYNQALGLRRARAAVSYLVSLGISRNRLEAVASFGETMPVIPTDGPERANRRTVTEVTGFVARHPTVMNGRYAEIVFREYVASAVPPSGLEGTSGADLQIGN